MLTIVSSDHMYGWCAFDIVLGRALLIHQVGYVIRFVVDVVVPTKRQAVSNHDASNATAILLHDIASHIKQTIFGILWEMSPGCV